MKKICLIFILQTVIFGLFAQKSKPVRLQTPGLINPAMDNQEYQGYTVRLIPVPPVMRSYGFQILKDNKPVHWFQKPLLSLRGRILKKEEAYKIAEWMIRDYKNTGHWQNTVPPHITHELKIKPR